MPGAADSCLLGVARAEPTDSQDAGPGTGPCLRYVSEGSGPLLHGMIRDPPLHRLLVSAMKRAWTQYYRSGWARKGRTGTRPSRAATTHLFGWGCERRRGCSVVFRAQANFHLQVPRRSRGTTTQATLN